MEHKNTWTKTCGKTTSRIKVNKHDKTGSSNAYKQFVQNNITVTLR